MKLSVVIPTYDERENLPILIPRLEALFAGNEIEAEIIIVDGSSPDGTAAVAERLNKKFGNVKVLGKRQRQGIGAALRAGYDAAQGDIILSMDADLCLEEKEILNFLKKLNKGYDLVVGSRYSGRTRYEKKHLRTRVKNFISSAGNSFNRLISGVPLHDFTLNYRAIRGKAYRSIKTTDKTNTWLLEMILKTHYAGYKVTDIPVNFDDRKYGRSKLNLFGVLPQFLMRLISLAWQLRILRH